MTTTKMWRLYCSTVLWKLQVNKTSRYHEEEVEILHYTVVWDQFDSTDSIKTPHVFSRVYVCVCWLL